MADTKTIAQDIAAANGFPHLWESYHPVVKQTMEWLDEHDYLVIVLGDELHELLAELGYVRLDGVDVEALRKGLACVRWSPGGGYATHVPEIIVEVAETILALAEGETP